MNIAVLFCTLLGVPLIASAQGLGISSQGVSGGLVIPSAEVLDDGTFALTAGSYSEPQLGGFSHRRNMSFGVGLLPNVELFGRFADYQNPLPNSTAINGPRDISANLKLQLPSFWRGAPKFALGLNDVGGGAVFFRSAYIVASDTYGALRWSAGIARGSAIAGNPANGFAFKGGFLGGELFLGTPRLSALAEYDGQQRHAGLRFYSAALPALGNTEVIGTLQRSFGSRDSMGLDRDRTSFSISLVVPMGRNVSRAVEFKPENSLPALDEGIVRGMGPTAEDRMESLQNALMRAGLERVRVGTLGTNLLVEYENHRYEQNEADAIGVVLGLAVEHAPLDVKRVSAVVHKAGLRMYEASVGVAEYRGFLRHGDARFASGSLGVDVLPSYQAADVKWVNPSPTRRALMRVEIKPDITYTLATEVGAFDYSAAANVQGIVPLWKGAELYTSFIQRLANSDNFEPGSFFAESRHQNGLRVAALQQSFVIGRNVVANLGVGRYNHGSWGVQGESTVFIPGRDDVLRVKAGLYEPQPGQTSRQVFPLSGTYRWVHSPSTWVEAGLQKYSDGSGGPSVVLTRWFGDVAAQLFYRKGGSRQFAGLELSIPLTPRQGMEPGIVTVSGTAEFKTGVRTRIAGGSTSSNAVTANAVRDFQLDYNAETRQLNRGRTTEKYFIGQIYRMREAFYLYARDLLPN